jgi:hypothetical protein
MTVQTSGGRDELRAHGKGTVAVDRTLVRILAIVFRKEAGPLTLLGAPES